MGILDFGSSTNQPQGGLLGDMDPQSRAMVAMALINKFSSNNRGSQSGFGDIFNMMMQQQQLKRQAAADELDRQRFGLEQKRFSLDEQIKNASIAQAQREAEQTAKVQNLLRNIAQGVIDYKAQGSEMAPVIPEYEQPPVPIQNDQSPQEMSTLGKAANQAMPTPTKNQPFLVPTEGYINNLFSAADQARANPPKGAFIKDPQVREQAAALIMTGKPELIKQGYDLLQQGGSFTLKPGEQRYTGVGDVVATGKNSFNPDTYQQQKAIESRAQLDKETLTDSRKITTSALAAQQTVNDIRDLIPKINPALVGPVMGNIGRYTSQEVQELESLSNRLALQAKGIYGMPSNTFSNSDRDYIDRIAGGQKVDLPVLKHIINKIDQNLKIAIDRNAMQENQFADHGRILPPQTSSSSIDKQVQSSNTVRRYNPKTGRIE